MPTTNIDDIAAFLAVARERSFTRAAAQLGVSQSRLSQTIRALEERLGLRLLTRTTRSVAPTEAGERLLHTVGPRLDEIHEELAALVALRDRPAGNLRITTGEHAAQTILLPALLPMLSTYPDIHVEVVIDQALRDIVAERFDAGIRLGESLDKDMVALPISPDLRLIVVGAPGYFVGRPPPETPHDLADHLCINRRLQTLGDLYAWEFEKDGRALRVRVDGQLIVNTGAAMLESCLAGIGLAALFEDMAAPYLRSGRLIQVLDDWTPPFAGYHLYYPSRRQPTPALRVLINAMRQKRSGGQRRPS